jgi:hypothetical protein
VRQVEDDTPEVLWVANVQNQDPQEAWKRVPMKVKIGDFLKGTSKAEKSSGRESPPGNRFKVLEVTEADDDEPIMFVRGVDSLVGTEDFQKRPQAKVKSKMFCGAYGSRKMSGDGPAAHPSACECAEHRPVEALVRAVDREDGWASLGVGDIVIDSGADESCWPNGQGDAFPTKPSAKKLILRTANGGDMQHYGQKEVVFKHGGGSGPIGLTFQVTDVKKPLLAVRRLVEKGNTVVLADGDGESFIQHTASQTRIPVKKKGGSFVIEAHFVAQAGSLGFTRQA